MAFLRTIALAAAATTACIAVTASADQVDLVSFNGSDASLLWKWHDLNDPVMGGQSTSSFVIDQQSGVAVFNGTCRIVPQLKAPGFCNAETTDILRKAKDVSAYIGDALLLRVRSTIPYEGYKMSFAADTLDPQFKSYKCPFDVVADGSWQTVAIPWKNFSNDWSPFTGRCDTVDPTGKKHKCCGPEHPEVCPTSKGLKGIQAFGIWTEGVAGDFHLEVAWIGAGTLDGEVIAKSALVTGTGKTPQWESSCDGKIQRSLRFNMSSFKQSDLPGALPGESLAQAVCCDVAFKPYAEPTGTFQDSNVALFSKLNATGINIFYDSACGKPLFQAPINRTFAEWQQESITHGWPSFRDAEVIKENVVVHADTGEVISGCGKGTHLGSYAPDDLGPRYCIDLACISGNPAN